MQAVKYIKAIWNRFWFITGPPHALGIFRIFYGIYWLIIWLSWLPHVSLYFSGKGMYFPAFYPDGRSLFHFQSFVAWVTHSPSVQQAWALYLSGIVLLLFILLGYKTRAALILFFLCLNYHYYAYIHMHGTSYDRLMLIILLLLILSPCHAAISIDAWRTRKKQPLKINAVYNLWTQRMICVQVAIVYVATGIHKLLSPAWKNGNDFAAAFYGDYATPLGFYLAKMNIPAAYYDAFSILLIVFELSAGFLLFSKRWQKWAFIAGGLFHIMNSTLLWIPQFLVVICTYILFVDPEKVALFISKKDNKIPLST